MHQGPQVQGASKIHNDIYIDFCSYYPNLYVNADLFADACIKLH